MTKKQQQFIITLARLTQRQLFILNERHNLMMTLGEIADQLGLTVERVRQIQNDAMRRIESADYD